MGIRVLGLSAAFAAVFAAGVIVGGTRGDLVPEAFAQGQARVFELRTYTAPEGKIGDLHARFRDHTLGYFQKHGMTNVVYLAPLDEPLSKNTLTYLLAYPSREAAKQSWDAFRADPGWKKARDASEANGKIVAKVESVFYAPTPYSPLR